MHKLYDLKDMLCEELEEYGSKDKLDVGSLDVVDKLAHAIKNIDKIIECKEDEYSGNLPTDGSYRGRGSSYRMNSYAGRRGAKRDAMGRYSSTGYSRAEGDFMADLEDLMHSAPNEAMKQKIQKIMNEM